MFQIARVIGGYRYGTYVNLTPPILGLFIMGALEPKVAGYEPPRECLFQPREPSTVGRPLLKSRLAFTKKKSIHHEPYRPF